LFVLFYLNFSYFQVFAESTPPFRIATLKKHEFLYFRNSYYVVKPKDTLVQLAVKFRVGYRNLKIANHIKDPWILKTGKKLIIPYQIVLPKDFLALKKGNKRVIIVNLPEMRLYFFYSDKCFVAPIGIGIKGKLPPEGVYWILRKKENPTWYPPPSIKEKNPNLPKFLPPGPDNPLGKYALYLSKGLYAIHGTNRIYSIGRRSTHGCIRLYPEDIKFLYENVKIPTKVIILYEPIKIAIQKDKVYIQAFPDIEKKLKNPLVWVIKKLKETSKRPLRINLIKLYEILKSPDGLVHEIGKVVTS